MPKLNEVQWTANRQRIVDSAFELFAKYGYAKVSVNEIIKAAGISKGNFYTYFHSKQDIFLMIVEQSDASKVTLASRMGENLEPSRRIAQYVRLRLENFLNTNHSRWVKFSSEFWATVEMTAEMEKRSSERYDAFAQDLGKVIQEGVENGDFAADTDVSSLVYVIMSMIDGIASMSAVMKHPLDEHKINMAVEMVENYLKARGNK
jgi:AcrR family transcriptional regulator